MISQLPTETNPHKSLGYSYRRHLGERFIEAVLFLMAFISRNHYCYRSNVGEGVICIF